MCYRLAKLIVILIMLHSFKKQTFGADRPRRLYNGRKAEWTNFNFVVGIIVNAGDNWKGHCTGSLLEPDRVLTSAHCFFARNNRGNEWAQIESQYVKVGAGERYWSHDPETSFWTGVSHIIIHKDYNSFASDCDLAMLILKEQVPVDGEKVGLVEYRATPPPEGSICVAAGWGLAHKHFLPRSLRSGNFIILPYDRCRFSFGVESKNFLCGLSPEGSNVCSGDSGGPLICEGKLTAIIDSSGMNCTLPSLFTSIAQFKNWIDHGYQDSLSRSSTFKFFKITASLLNFVFVYLLYIW